MYIKYTIAKNKYDAEYNVSLGRGIIDRSETFEKLRKYWNDDKRFAVYRVEIISVGMEDE